MSRLATLDRRVVVCGVALLVVIALGVGVKVRRDKEASDAHDRRSGKCATWAMGALIAASVVSLPSDPDALAARWQSDEYPGSYEAIRAGQAEYLRVLAGGEPKALSPGAFEDKAGALDSAATRSAAQVIAEVCRQQTA